MPRFSGPAFFLGLYFVAQVIAPSTVHFIGNDNLLTYPVYLHADCKHLVTRRFKHFMGHLLKMGQFQTLVFADPEIWTK